MMSLAWVLAGGLAAFAGSPGQRPPVDRRNTPPGLADATLIGHADPDQSMSVVITLDLRDHAGVDQLITAQQDPTSPLYHQWISPEEFQERFGPLPSDIQAARDFLADQGFTNIDRPTSTMVRGQGNVALAEAAFRVTINKYMYHGQPVIANDSDPVLPSELSSKVVQVGGLDTLSRAFPLFGSATVASPEYLLSGTNYILARDNQVAYGQKAGYFDLGKKGTPGSELAVASAYDINATSINDILTRQGGAAAGYNLLTTALSGPHTISSTCVPSAGTDPSPGCVFDMAGVANIETAMDTSLAASVANDSHIGVYLTRDLFLSSFGIVYQYLADRAGTIKVVTHSWGLCLSLTAAGTVTADDNAFAQAAAAGQAWFIATGDAGSNACPSGSGGANPDIIYPAASPYVTAVGGTSQDPTSAFGGDGWMSGYPPNGEVACSDAGGGEANAGVTEPRPAWQTGTGVPAGTNRLVPDVSMHYGQCTTPSTGKNYLATANTHVWILRGTSADAPQWAGYWAVANQVTGATLGNAAPLMWRILNNQGGTSYASCFHDVTSGNNGGFTAGAGFDEATGIGTPKFDGIYPALSLLTGSGVLNGTITAGGSPASGASVSATGFAGTYTATANGSGFYQFPTIPPGTYSVTASFGGYSSSTASGVVVNNGATTVQNFTLNTLATTTPCNTDTTQAQFQAGTASSTSVDMITSPGDVKLVIGNAGSLADQAALDDLSGFAFTNTSWAAQTFTPSVTGQLTRVDLYLFCSGCSGADPNITVSIRNTTGGTGGTPTGADLASFTIPGFNDNGNGTWISSNFASPPTVTAGTTYAVLWRLTASRTGSQAYVSSGTTSGGGDGDVYPNGRGCTSANSGSTWTCGATAATARDNDFVAWVKPTTVNTSVDLISTVKDANPLATGTPHWTTLSWTSAVPANTSLKFQAATSNSPTGPFTSWKGPDGTSATFFTTSPASLPSASFSGRYLEWRAFLGATTAGATPTLSDVTVCADDTCNGLANGTPCNDGNACTQTDTCQNNVCVGSNPVICPADQCHNAGTCNTGTGVCSAATTKPDNTGCNDGVACTYNDVCTSGVCGGTSITCTNDQCNTRTCNGTSQCSVTPLNNSTPTTCGVGACASTGVIACVNGVLQPDTCTPGNPQPETCNNIDDNCNGVVDEGLTQPTTCGVGACASTGHTTCVNGSYVNDTCTPGTPAASDTTCDGIDDNCNGLVDDGYVSQPTTCGVGACASTGSTSCVNGHVADSCTPGSPTPETCNGIDDNCNGVVDEGLTQPTTCGVGACASTGHTTCVNGSYVNDTCTPGNPQPETCNGIDDNCDGVVDEGLTQPTTCGVGACASTGHTTCVNGSYVNDTCTPGTPAASDTTCDGIDDDCNGLVDDGFVSQPTTCGTGACATTGSTSCVNGHVVDSCHAGSGAEDDTTCDGVDDDCNGIVDDGYVGQPTSCGVGACAATGSTSCVNGHVNDTCTPGTPHPETCNNIDDNCNGSVDEGTDVPTTCGVGVCGSTGVRACVNGVLQPDTCTPPSGTACDDGNPCTVGDTCGGGVCNAGSTITAPPETANVAASNDKATYTWSPATFATRYDVVRGSLAAFPVGPGGADELCFDNLSGTTLIDGTTPGPGTGFWYLSRGENSCGAGTYGNSSSGPRSTTTCAF